MKSSYLIPKDKAAGILSKLEMTNQEGVYLYGAADPDIKRLLPYPLELTDPDNPMIYIYIVNIRKPSFAPWYLEGGIGTMVKYGEKSGVYFFSLQLSGPGALMGAFAGRESAGLPKKLCESIIVERTDKHARCQIMRGGVSLIDIELEIGQYNIPEYKLGLEDCADIKGGVLTDGGCLLHKYDLDVGPGVKDLGLYYYDSPTRYFSFEPASATVKLGSTINDPWGEIPLTSVYGAAWSVCDNWCDGMSLLYNYTESETDEAMCQLFSGRYDRGLISEDQQIYETK